VKVIFSCGLFVSDGPVQL